MSQYKDSRPLNVDFDYDSLDILCPTTFASSATFGGPITISPLFPFSQNTWPRMEKYTFPLQGPLVANAFTNLLFAIPTLTATTWTNPPALTSSSYYTFTPATGFINFIATGVYTIKLILNLSAAMGATQNYRIYMGRGPTPPPPLVITQSLGHTTGAGGNPPILTIFFETSITVTTPTENISFAIQASEVNSVTPILSIIKLG